MGRIAIALFVVLAGCTSRTSIRHAGSEIGERGTAQFKDGQERDASLVGYVPQGVVLHDGYQTYQVGYEHLHSLEYKSHAGGAWQGFKYGLLTGVLLGLVWGVAVSSETEEGNFLDDPGEAAAFGAVMFGMTGMVFGTPIGAIKGKTTVYAVDER